MVPTNRTLEDGPAQLGCELGRHRLDAAEIELQIGLLPETPAQLAGQFGIVELRLAGEDTLNWHGSLLFNQIPSAASTRRIACPGKVMAGIGRR